MCSSGHSWDRYSVKEIPGIATGLQLNLDWAAQSWEGCSLPIDAGAAPPFEVPVSQVTTSWQRPSIRLVERILAAKEVDPSADTSEFEEEVDRIVYNLYGLTDEKIAVVEGTI